MAITQVWRGGVTAPYWLTAGGAKRAEETFILCSISMFCSEMWVSANLAPCQIRGMGYNGLCRGVAQFG